MLPVEVNNRFIVNGHIAELDSGEGSEYSVPTVSTERMRVVGTLKVILDGAYIVSGWHWTVTVNVG